MLDEDMDPDGGRFVILEDPTYVSDCETGLEVPAPSVCLALLQVTTAGVFVGGPEGTVAVEE